LGSAWEAGQLSVETFQYLGQYFKYTKDAIAVLAYADIIYASYALIKLAFRFDEPMETVLTHLNGVSRCISYSDTRPVYMTSDDQMCMKRIWNDLLADFYLRILRDRRHEDFDTLASHVDTICGFLEPHWPRIVATLRMLGQREVSVKVLEHNMRTVEIYFQYYFLRYLVTVNGDRDQEQCSLASECLREVCHEMIQLGDNLKLVERFDVILDVDTIQRDNITDEPSPKHVHKIRFEKALLSPYLWAQAIDGSLALASSPSAEQSVAAALGLCRMYREWAITLTTFEKDTCSYNDARNLFLAGLVLTKDDFPRGNIYQVVFVLIWSEKAWVKACLAPCIQAGSSRYQLHPLVHAEIGLLQAFMDEADHSALMKDIWTMKLKDIYVWQCVLGFSWFWGLDIIRRI
jgi:hypothetical protein